MLTIETSKVVNLVQLNLWAGWVGEVKYGLIAAARGAFTS